ncbi:MAG: hypothetical protein WBD20_10350 [Pirellulaceae bacterium]
MNKLETCDSILDEQMRYLTIITWLTLQTVAFSEEVAPRTVVWQIDPRIVTITNDTLPIEWKGLKTDVIAKRYLTKHEAKELSTLMREELTASTQVPFCGHNPAFAIVTQTRDGKTERSTLCGLCGTWGRNGELRVLAGRKTLAYLEELMPLPDVFAHVRKQGDLFNLDRTVPFYSLPLTETIKASN